MTDVAREGGEIAGNARKEIEANMGRPVVTSKNAAALNAVVANLIEDVADKTLPFTVFVSIIGRCPHRLK